MSINLIIKEEAVTEIDEAYIYYEQQKAGLGSRFLDKLGYGLEGVQQTPQHYAFFQNQNRYRSHSIAVFPFIIIYEATDNDVIVFAVYNTYKNPAGLFKRLP